MKQLLGFLGVIALVQGVGGLVSAAVGRSGGWGLVRLLGFLDGYEVYASGTLVVLSVSLFASAESRGRSGG